MRQPLVAGNWKMHGSLHSIKDLLVALKAGIATVTRAEVAVCAPAIFIPEVRALLQGTAIAWGGQDLSVHEIGAYTGEISAAMLQEFGCRYVIIGHSERRAYHKESNTLIADKLTAACRLGLLPIVCIGETLEQRERGVTEAVLVEQLDAILKARTMDVLTSMVIAYEPVWAIGTGRNATPEQAQQVHAFIRAHVAKYNETVADSLRIIYGGSLKSSNAKELLRQPDIDGGLVGGASLQAADFLAICVAIN